ncbi:MAG: class I SAM-dependent methyltransferase [Thiotrichales bacterium]|nr:class I SAM-dependent methyltransferase [Thiotrichales bacterium]
MTAKPEHSNTPLNLLRQKLHGWFSTEPGQGLLALEKHYLGTALNRLFGYHLLQLGRYSTRDLLESSRIAHKVVLDLYREEVTDRHSHLLSSSDQLPFAEDSLDVVVLPHVLEFEKSPHQILRETERILIGEGHVVIIGFNPWSLWGLWRLLLAWRDEPPWCGNFLAQSRIRDWLTLLDFEMVQIEYFYFRPPLKHHRIMRTLEFMEKLGRYACPYFGGAYLVVAKKRVIPLTPVKLSWQARRRMITSGIVEPSARIEHGC